MFEISNSVSPTNTPAVAPSQNQNWLKYALGGCGCVTLLLLVVVGVFVTIIGLGVGGVLSKAVDLIEKNDEARYVADEFMEHMQEGRTREAYALTTEGFRKKETLAELESWAADVQKYGEAKSRHFIDVESEVHRQNGEPEFYRVVHFEYRNGRERDVIRCPVQVIETTSSNDTPTDKGTPGGFEVSHVDCIRAHVAYRKAWGDNPPRGDEEEDERVVTGWKKYKQPKIVMPAAAAAGARWREHLLEGEYAEAREFLPRARRKDFGEEAFAKLADVVRKHDLRKSEFYEWSNMNLIDAWLANGVGTSNYRVQLLNPTDRSGTRLVLDLTRDYDFNKPEGQRAGPFQVTKIEINKGG